MSEAVKLSSSNAQSAMEAIERLTLLEMSELVKALEEKFGVTAAAPMAMAPAATSADVIDSSRHTGVRMRRASSAEPTRSSGPSGCSMSTRLKASRPARWAASDSR